jgi:hypothetical protein
MTDPDDTPGGATFRNAAKLPPGDYYVDGHRAKVRIDERGARVVDGDLPPGSHTLAGSYSDLPADDGTMPPAARKPKTESASEPAKTAPAKKAAGKKTAPPKKAAGKKTAPATPGPKAPTAAELADK